MVVNSEDFTTRQGDFNNGGALKSALCEMVEGGALIRMSSRKMHQLLGNGLQF